MINRKIFRHLIFFFGFLICLNSGGLIAQTIPPFKIRLTNGTAYTYKDVPKTKPLLIIYFAPDCGHCKALILEMVNNANKFKKAQILLVSFEPLSMVSKFERDYHLSSYFDVKCGTETPTFYFKNLFNLAETPFTALYNKKGKLITSYKEVPKVDDLVKRLNIL